MQSIVAEKNNKSFSLENILILLFQIAQLCFSEMWPKEKRKYWK